MVILGTFLISAVVGQPRSTIEQPWLPSDITYDTVDARSAEYTLHAVDSLSAHGAYLRVGICIVLHAFAAQAKVCSAKEATHRGSQ